MAKIVSNENTCILFSILTLGLFTSSTKPKVEIQGELKKWHKITLVFDGPETSELAEVNPYLNYRLIQKKIGWL